MLEEPANHFLTLIFQVDIGEVAVALQADDILHLHHFEAFESREYDLLLFRLGFAEVLYQYFVAVEDFLIDDVLLNFIHG